METVALSSTFLYFHMVFIFHALLCENWIKYTFSEALQLPSPANVVLSPKHVNMCSTCTNTKSRNTGK